MLDNAVAESFFATIKRELVNDRARPTRAGLQRAIFEYIVGWYNTPAGSIPPTGISAPPNTGQSTRNASQQAA